MTSFGSLLPALSGAALVVASLFAPRASFACATCGAGDATLSAVGMEQPYAGRLRAALQLQTRSDRIGAPVENEYRIREYRGEASLSWSPARRWLLLAIVPLVYRDVTDSNLAVERTAGLGEVEVRTKLTVFRDRELAPRHLLSWMLGSKLPTSTRKQDATGRALPLEAQAGSGSLDLLLGPSYTLFLRPLSLYGSAQLMLPIATRAPLEPGASLRGTLAAQYQLATWWSMRWSLDGRADQPTYEDGTEDPNSGGFVLFSGPELLLSPVLDWLLACGVRAPVFQALNGHHHEGWAAHVALTHDL